jgi:hypothetical protein
MRAREFIDEHRMVWKRNAKTGKISLRWRCESGPRDNRTVPHVSDCSKAPDMAQSQRMKKTRARTKVRQARRTKRTKRINPASRLAARLNKYR